jgi:vacuolar-type H+-ATPase subunit H
MVSVLLTRTIRREKGQWMTAEHGSASENLLEQIATTEQQLEQKVGNARDEARRLLDDARGQAEAARQAALREAEELITRTRRETSQEAETVASRRIAEATAEAERVRAQAAERIAGVADTVVQRVLSDLE